MSQSALSLAVMEFLREKLARGREVIDLRPPPGKPIPNMGDSFIAIVDGGPSVNPADHDLDETYDLQIVVTKRLGAIPDDRSAVEAIDKLKVGLNDLCATVRAHVHGNPYEILERANRKIGIGTANGFIEPLRAAPQGPVTSQGMDWFSAEEPEGGTGFYCGFSRTLPFRGARRIQGLPDVGYVLT